jgi:hypothetical protein
MEAGSNHTLTGGLFCGDPIHILPGQVGDHWQVYIYADGGQRTGALAYGYSAKEALANARLLAAAPALLAALKYIQHNPVNGPEIDSICRVAIAKATGEEAR